MSELVIPCKQPWSSVTVENPRDMVKITVGKNNRIREYEVHADVLKNRSGYFRKKLPDITEIGDKGKRAPVHLPDEAPIVFDAFVHFLYHGKLRRLDVSEGGDSFLFLCQLSTFAVAFEAPLFCNAIVDTFLWKAYRAAPEIPYDIAGYLQEHCRDMALRDMFIDIVMNCGDKETLAYWNISLGKGYFRSIYVEGGVVPFCRSGDIKEYMNLLRRQVCGRYHEHPVGDEEEATEWPPFFFDPPLE